VDRVVIDPGVLVSALLTPRGAPAALYRAWREGAVEFIVSPALLGELEAVLARPKFRSYVTHAEADAFVATLRREAELVDDPAPTPGVTPDPKDDYLVAVARAARASFLVSGDPHLTGLRDASPPVLTPRGLVDRLGVN
jgi:putative PIN family toxin of toxin-antitoxin system